MAAFFQLLRDRIFGRAVIILQRQPEVNDSEEEKSSSCDSIANNDDAMKISEARKSEVDFTNLYSDLKHDNALEIRCKSALTLALYLIQDSPDVEFSDILEALNNLGDSHNFPDLAVCHALLLCSFTKLSMSLMELERLENTILSLTGSLKRKDIANQPRLYKIAVLIEHHNEMALKICQQLFSESYLDFWEIDISTICCCTLYNLSSLVKQHDNELGANYCFKNNTVKFILGMTGKSTQEIVSEFMVSQKQFCPSVSSHRVNQCLHVLEHALSANPRLSSVESLQHESFSLPHCLTRLLGWSVSSVFPGDNAREDITSDNYKFHLSTLVCILKVLSVLTFNPHQYDSFTNVKGLMEKILICTLKAYFESESNHFDIQILCLEMLINLYIKNQKTFVLLCLKRFKINESEEVLAVEALLKMLSDNLEKIKEVKESTPYPQNNDENKPNQMFVHNSNDNSDTDIINESSNKKPRKEVARELSDENAIKNSEASIAENSTTENIVMAENSTNKNIVKKSKKENVESDPVLLAASKDMEHSTIVSFICVLIVFFMRTKQSFKEFILSKLTSQSLKEATDVSRKFLEFASLTGGMPVTGILILTQTINKLQALQTV